MHVLTNCRHSRQQRSRVRPGDQHVRKPGTRCTSFTPEVRCASRTSLSFVSPFFFFCCAVLRSNPSSPLTTESIREIVDTSRFGTPGLRRIVNEVMHAFAYAFTPVSFSDTLSLTHASTFLLAQGTHNTQQWHFGDSINGIGRASLRRDGFVGWSSHSRRSSALSNGRTSLSSGHLHQPPAVVQSSTVLLKTLPFAIPSGCNSSGGSGDGGSITEVPPPQSY